MKCLQCDTDTSNPKFCSNKCQQDKRKTLIIERWLRSGTFTCHPDNGVSSCYKEYVLKEQEDKCSICGMPSVWNGRPLTMILDHIDGNYMNNHRNNLRCNCPNCDIQLPTSKGEEPRQR